MRAAEQRPELSPRRVREPWETDLNNVLSRGAATEPVPNLMIANFDNQSSRSFAAPYHFLERDPALADSRWA